MMTRFLFSSLFLVAFVCSASAQKTIHTFEKIQLTEKFYAEGANAGDFNNDGVMDIVSGPFWYQGPDFKTKHTIYPPVEFDITVYSKNFFPHAYDFNNDGWMDIFLIGFPGEDASWFKNPGASGGDWVRYKVFDVVDNESPAWTDLTGDGKPEIVCNSGGYFGYVTPDWSNPEKPWTFHPISGEERWANFTHGLGVGDVNGDGRMDVLEANGWREQPASLVGDPAWEWHEVAFARGGSQMYAYDFDGDGDNDVITAMYAHGYGLLYFEQSRVNGKIVFTQHVIMGDEPSDNKYGVKFSQLHAVDLVDMDGDGIKDIVTGKRKWAHSTDGDPEPLAPAVTYWFKTTRTTNGVEFVPYQISDNTGVGVQVVATDVNGDDLPDVIVGNKIGAAVLIHHVEEVNESRWQEAQPKVYGGR